VTTTDYRPISCGLHSAYELLAMHRTRVCVEVRGPDGAGQSVSGQVVDVCTRDGAEYLELVTDGGERVAYRLDRLLTVTTEDGRQIADPG
jgi:transcriptional antiterminator Rof (Rho-off)